MPVLAPNPLDDTTAGVPGGGYTVIRRTGMNAVNGPPVYGNPTASLNTLTRGRPRFAMTSNGPVLIPTDWSDEDAATYVHAWDQQIATIKQAMQEASGFQRLQLQSQLEDAEKGRQNALRIARLNNETSRYGTDVQRRTAMAQLKENARQFDLRHGLDVQQLGLDRAKTATEYLATPDRWAQAGNYLALSGRVLAGQPGAGSYGTSVAPRPNTEQDFAVLQSGGNPYAGRGDAAAAAGGTGAGADARTKALKAVISGYTPSNGVGLDANDYAVLNATRAIMGMNLTPQQQATIRSDPEYRAILGSNMRNLGQNPDSWWTRQQQSLPGQGRVGAA